MKNKTKLDLEPFTIISNNCWGGTVYDKYHLQYQSPTIGCFFMADDYIRFISHLDYYLSQELKQRLFSQSIFKDKLVSLNNEELKRYYFDKGDSVLIGVLDDIEVILFHSTSFKVAKEKWDRRTKRVNYNRLVIKFNDQNGCTEKDVIDFEKLEYKNKIFFTANKKYKKLSSCSFFVRRYSKIGYVMNDTDLKKLKFNEKKYLESCFK